MLLLIHSNDVVIRVNNVFRKMNIQTNQLLSYKDYKNVHFLEFHLFVDGAAISAIL